MKNLLKSHFYYLPPLKISSLNLPQGHQSDKNVTKICLRNLRNYFIVGLIHKVNMLDLVDIFTLPPPCTLLYALELI